MELVVRPGRVTAVFASIIAILVAAQVCGMTMRFAFDHNYVFGLVPLFDFDREHNIPSLYSAISLLCCSGLLAIMAASSQRSRNRDAGYWCGLAILFFLVSLDEHFSVHERLTEPLRQALNLSGPFYYAWVVPYGLLVSILGVIYLRFLLRLPADTRFRFLTAGFIYLGGAVGVEMLGGAHYEQLGEAVTFSISLLVTVEELLEMIGVLVFLHALLSAMAEMNLRVRISSSPLLTGKPEETLGPAETLEALSRLAKR